MYIKRLATEEDRITQVSHHFGAFSNSPSNDGRQGTCEGVLEEPNDKSFHECRCNYANKIKFTLLLALTKTPYQCLQSRKNRCCQ